MPSKRSFMLAAIVAVCLSSRAQKTPAIISVDASHPGAKISSQMYGIFFEDINFAADGGLYPELVKNRSFEFDQPLAGWKEILGVGPGGIAPSKGELGIRSSDPLNEHNTHYLRVRVYEPGYGLQNFGFRGIGVKEGEEYRFSVFARSSATDSLRVVLTDQEHHEIGKGQLHGFGTAWKRYETVIRATSTVSNATLNIFFDKPGSLDLDMVSLYPVDTWKRRPNGLRKDLVQLLADMHPGFLRFPGGCIVEGRILATRYRWKTTVGDLANRQTIINRWNDEFDHRPTPDYFQSFGLGFYEYFQLAEDIGARPLPILNCGMACQFNSNETAKVEELHEYIQDALDLIDFANGPITSPWGKLRAQMGHPAPFHLTMIGVGNEQWGPRYVDRYKVFAGELKAKHPEIKLVVSAGPSPDGDTFQSMWSAWRSLNADIVDEHYYMDPAWFLANSNRYDKYDRSGPKVFAGEYAAQSVSTTSPKNRNNWKTAISEAAFMTGLERNGDVVQMASYAPLMANVNAWQWTPDAIWFDNLHSYGTPDYYVQQLFSSNTGTRVIPSTPHADAGLYTSTVLDESSRTLIVKAINYKPDATPAQINLTGATPAGPIKQILLTASDLDAENTFEHPTAVSPRTAMIDASSASIPVQLEPYSINIYRIPIR